MAYEFESLQSALPPTVPSGWNDPPPMLTPSGGSANRLAQLRRRPVDPSIQGAAGSVAGYTSSPSPQQTAPYGGPQGHQAGYTQPTSMPQQQTAGHGVQPPQQGQPAVYPQPQHYAQQPGMYAGAQTMSHSSPSLNSQPHYGVPAPASMGHVNNPPVGHPAGTAPVGHPGSAGTAPVGQHGSANGAPFAPASYQQPPASGPPGQPAAHFYTGSQPPLSQLQQTQVPAHAYPLSSVPGYPQPHQHHPPQPLAVNQQPTATSIATVAAHNSYSQISSPAAPEVASGMPSSQAEMRHRPIYDAFTVNGSSSPASMKTADPFVVSPQPAEVSSGETMLSSHPSPAQAAWTAASAGMPPATQPGTIPNGNGPPHQLHMSASLDSNPTSLVFAPPNAVNDARNNGAQDGGYNVPVKAAGDVSLSGPQLVAFLTKASHRLPQVKCQGVQLRLNQLNELVQQNQISEGCLKKLNFVVDAIDRELYDEASLFFEQLQSQYPEEMTAWSQGLKLLILELKRPSGTRIGSAGAHIRSQ